MLPPTSIAMEKVKQQEFYKEKIRESFKLVDTSNQGYLPKEEISYLMRYLGQFPSEAQVRDYILPQLEDDEPSDFIKYDKFETYMVGVMQKNEFEPA